MSTAEALRDNADSGGQATAPAGFERLHPKAIWSHRLGFLFGLLFPFLGLAVALLVVLHALDLPASVLSRLGVVIALALLWLRLAWRLGERAFRATRYRLDDQGLEIHRGIWWRSEVRVLRSRVQHTDLQRGPLDRRLGLADLELHTAGSKDATVKLAGLDAERAEALRDLLLQGHDRQF